MEKDKKKFLKGYLLQRSKINRLEEMILSNPKKREEYEAEIESCNQTRTAIEKAINTLENDILKEILFQKYICGKTLEEVSLIINYSKRHTERMHIKALQNLKI